MADVLPFPGAAAPAPLEARGDDELMLLAAAGERAAFAVLVARHARRLIGYAAKMLGDNARAEELVQEVWLQLWNARQTYRGDGRFLVFVYTITRNRCRNAYRDASRRVRTGPQLDEASFPDGSPGQLDVLVEREQARRLYDALARLPEKYREPLVLRFSEGLDHAEIATIVDCTESAARSRVHHGLTALRQQLAKQGEKS